MTVTLKELAKSTKKSFCDTHAREAYRFDQQYRALRTTCIAGVDEVGRGSLAGPVVAACVILPPRFYSRFVVDSKLLTPKERSHVAVYIKSHALAYGISYANNFEVDRFNVLQATFLAMQRALVCMGKQPDVLLIDGPRAPSLFPRQHCVIDGDNKSLNISAASIIAKVFRDRFMDKYHRLFPRYDFLRNKGYLTPNHLRALTLHGPCRIHRMSFAPVREQCFNQKLLI